MLSGSGVVTFHASLALHSRATCAPNVGEAGVASGGQGLGEEGEFTTGTPWWMEQVLQ